MPTVLSFDDPAIVATLASQASRYATDQQGMQEALRVAQLNSSRGGGGGQPAGGPGTGMEEYGQPAGTQPNMSLPSWTEQTPQGATIYHPQGEAQPAQPGGQLGYLAQHQQQLMQYVDQLDKGGQLQPGEAIRMKGQIIGGGNPFDKPTINESIATKTATDGMNSYQQAELQNQQSRLNNTSGTEDYNRRRENLLDQLKTTQQLYSSSAGDTETQKTLKGELDALRTQLKNLPGTYNAGGTPNAAGPNPANAAAPGATNPAATGTAGANAAGSVSIKSVAPPTPNDALYLVKKYGNANAARQAAARGERAPA